MATQGIHDEVEIEDMIFSPETAMFHYSCPCGDKFEISLDDLLEGDDIAHCRLSCTLRVRVIFDDDALTKYEARVLMATPTIHEEYVKTTTTYQKGGIIRYTKFPLFSYSRYSQTKWRSRYSQTKCRSETESFRMVENVGIYISKIEYNVLDQDLRRGVVAENNTLRKFLSTVEKGSRLKYHSKNRTVPHYITYRALSTTWWNNRLSQRHRDNGFKIYEVGINLEKGKGCINVEFKVAQDDCCEYFETEKKCHRKKEYVFNVHIHSLSQGVSRPPLAFSSMESALMNFLIHRKFTDNLNGSFNSIKEYYPDLQHRIGDKMTNDQFVATYVRGGLGTIQPQCTKWKYVWIDRTYNSNQSGRILP